MIAKGQTADGQSFTRLKRPIFWLKSFLRVQHFLSLINHYPWASITMPEVHIRTREVVASNRVEFTARKTHCCLLSSKRISDPDQSVCMAGMEIARSETLDVVGTSVRSDLCWDDHIFNVSNEAAKCLGFWKRCKKYFNPSNLNSIYITYIRPKMEYNSNLWAGTS